MIRSMLCLFICLICPTADLFAQAENGSLLYEISGKQLKKPSYVFGTIHLRDKRAFEQVNNKKDSLWYCFNHSEIIAGELKFDKSEMKATVKEHVLLPKGVTLESLLTKEEYEKVKAYAKEVLGWQAVAIDQIKPFFTLALMTGKNTASDYKHPLDIYLQQQGEKKKKEIVGIETAEEQIKALSSMSLQEQARELVEYVNNPTQGDAEMEQMIELYRQRRTVDLYELIRSFELSDTVEAALLTDRNLLMADRIEEMMLRKPVFAAIGSAHLAGDRGVLALLSRRGYSVRPVDKKQVVSGH